MPLEENNLSINYCKHSPEDWEAKILGGNILQPKPLHEIHFDQNNDHGPTITAPNQSNEFLEFISDNGFREGKQHEENVQLFIFYCISKAIVSNEHELTEAKLIQGLMAYKRHLYELSIANQLAYKKYLQLLFSIDLYFKFLANVKHFVITLEKPVVSPLYPLFDNLGCPQFRQFIEELVNKNFLTIDPHIIVIKRFLRHLGTEVSKNIHVLKVQHIQVFETILMQQVLNKEILLSSAHQYLYSIRRFINFLYRNKIISFQYEVPERFHQKGTRDNEYVDVASREKFLECILTTAKKSQKRDFCIVMLLIETGCRPLELCTLRIGDIQIKEHTISLFSNKSRTRTLKIASFVMSIISDFIKTERNYAFPYDTLFVTNSGVPLEPRRIKLMIWEYNKIAFGEIKLSAKSFRHTYITDAFNNRNDFSTVSESVGHKKWSSTMHYLHRSIPRLLNHTLPYNPMKKGEE
jgi:site-specific recombinase XerD